MASNSPASAPPNDSWIRVAIILAACAPFLSTLLFGYVYDDAGILLHNPIINGWHSLAEVWKYPYWTDSDENGGLYRPLLMAVFAAIWNGAHKYAIAFHFFVLLMHVFATLLLWRLLRRATTRWAAAGATLWFALHPVHVEAVANIANSSEVIVAVFALWAVLIVDPPRGWRIIASAAIYAAALLTKESGAVIPLLALVFVSGWRAPDAPRRPFDVRVWSRMLGAWTLVALGVSVMRRLVLGGLVSSVSIAAPGIADLSAPRRIWAMLSLGPRLLSLLFWPANQNPHYGPTVLATHGSVAAASTIVVLATAFVLAWRFRERDSRPLTALLWMCIAFLPASNLLVPTGQILAERTLYVSTIGAAMLVAWMLDLAMQRVPRVAVAIAFGVICLFGFVRAREYTAVWKDQQRLFTYMTVADPQGYRGYQLLALEMDRRNQPDSAAKLFAHAYELFPADRILTADYAAFLLEKRRPLDALNVARRLMEHPDLRTNPRAVTLVLNSTYAAFGVDSLLAAAYRMDASDPSPTAKLFIKLGLDARGKPSAR